MAVDFNMAQIERQFLTAAHLRLLVKCWQERAGLKADGLAGDAETIPSLDQSIVSGAMPVAPPVLSENKTIEVIDKDGLVETYVIRWSK
jgi:hypothetical protein